MYSWQPPANNTPSQGFWAKLIGLGTLIGALAAGIQNFTTVQDFANKGWERVQILFFPTSALDRVYLAHRSQSLALCNSTQYAELFKVSPCGVLEISKQQELDTSQPSSLVTSQLHDFNAELVTINNLLIGGYQRYGAAKERDYASLTAKNEIERIKNVRDLIDKRIHLGQFNSQRLRIYWADKKNMDALKAKHHDS